MASDLRLILASLGALALGATVAAGCSTGSLARGLGGPAPTAAESSGRPSIPAVSGPASPLIVDWKSEQRADLEEAIADGIAVVAWTDDGLTLLKRCRVAGEYGYLPIQVKKDVVRLESAEDVAANLPLGGPGIAASLAAEFERGATLDIAMAMVGKRRTTWTEVTRGDLVGQCEGATHYVRAVLVGAFAMQTGTRAKARAAAEIFKAKVGGGSSSASAFDSSDGQLDDCERATEAGPPGRCQALLRLELEPISDSRRAGPAAEDAGRAAADPDAPDAVPTVTCAPGLVFREGKCTRPSDQAAHACAPEQLADCETQCGRGDLSSCVHLGVAISFGRRGPPDPAAALPFFLKACDGGHAVGCRWAGQRRAFGERDVASGRALLEKACVLGDAVGCAAAGNLSLEVGEAPVAALWLERGCNGGSMPACTQAGFLYAGGSPAIPIDDVKSLAFSRKACFGGNAIACGNAGFKYEFGLGVPAQPALAKSLYERACAIEPGTCARLAILYHAGIGVDRDEARAGQLFETGCQAKFGNMAALACHAHGVLFGGTTAPPRAGLDQLIKTMAPQCAQKIARACAFQGIAEHGLGRRPAGRKLLAQACKLGDRWACLVEAKFD